MVRTISRITFIAAALLAAACSHTPRTQAQKQDLERNAFQAKEAMLNKDPSLRSLLDQSAGYIVFPEVKEGGFIVGGAGAQGVIFEQGQVTGYATLSRASIGAQVGGQKYAELIAVRDRDTLIKMKSGDTDLSGQASAVMLKSGAAAGANFSDKGVAVVMDPISGAMVNASIAGQRIQGTSKATM
jgi:lipid-binding SYLF domain-containing protein